VFQVLREWPQVSRTAPDILNLQPSPHISIDFEWAIRTGKPTILGASDGTRTVSVPHEEGKPYLVELLRRHPTARVLGHNIISADLPVAASEGIDIPLERVDDTILWHYLTNMSLCKGTKKADDEEGEKRGRGWMNLFAACSYYLSVPRWKDCVGEEQCVAESRPCPEHNVFGYNGNDCYWPAKAFPAMHLRARMLGVDRLYPLHRDLVAALTRMREKGVYVDRVYVDKLRDEFKADWERIEKLLPFNPNSPPQVRKYFAGVGIELKNAQQTTLEEAAEDYPENEILQLLCEYGELGNGVDRWFAPLKFDYKKNEWEGYVDDSGFIHPNLQPFTSTGRLACSNPNLQNISHRPKKHEDPKGGNTLADRIRRAIVAPEGYYLAEADLSNAENRVMLHLAGYAIPEGTDLHTWVAEMAGFKPDDPFCRKEGSPRQAAKTTQHASFYGEGLQLISKAEYRSPRVQNEISKGVRIAYPDWTFDGMIVTFTGINFARRAFGKASYENRVKANKIISQLFGRFPGVRELQKRISKQIERDRCVRNEFGYCLASYGFSAERIKTSLAFIGSNPVAHATKLAILNADRHPMLDCRLQIHDSLLFFVDKRHEPSEAKKWIREAMEVKLEEMGNLTIPVEVKVGDRWADLKKV
jgi:DNA polymerase I-like protein with 3'-5' exonuclease and polymerase domains